MNKTQQILKEREEEFDKEFVMKSSYPGVFCLNTENPETIKSFHATTISLLLNSLKEDIEKIVVEENYKLEEWYSSSERPKELTYFEANQKNMETRNKITYRISTLLSQTISNIQTK